ncbi:hypothetical protein QC764_406480 [Podospora pseudoanserina]|uniref:Uncharacterized protein n=1 Tax=Podospora pseudoanserina TaxID=2609844 RepID=A0ABR0IAA6_9PEZI|nr:hypothetical protein QC764_406480 [Podospora pseudoanserina]
MDPNATCTNNRPEVPFIPFLAGLTAWAVVRYVLEGIVKRFNPKFDKFLREDIRRRYNFYFSTWLGTIAKVISVVSCTAALASTPAEGDLYGLVRPLNTAEQWCWGCRAVLYIQELPDLSSVPELVIHHILSIVAMCTILAYSAPRRPLYLMWASLWNEFLGNARRLFKLHDVMAPRLAWWMAAVNCFLVWALRITAAVVSIVWTLQSNTYGVCLFVTIGSILVYILYMVQFTTWELGRFRVINLDMTRPARFIIADKWSIHLLGVIMGVGLALTELSALAIYGSSSGYTSSKEELHSIAWVALQAAGAGLLGSYVTFPIFRFTIPSAATSQEEDEEPTAPKAALRLSLIGGIISAGSTVVFTPTLEPTVDRAAFLACMGLSLPLMISIFRFGQAFSTPAAASLETNHASLDEKLVDVADEGIATEPGVFPPKMVNAAAHGVLFLGVASALCVSPPPSLLAVKGFSSFVLAMMAGVELGNRCEGRHRRFLHRLFPMLQAGVGIGYQAWCVVVEGEKGGMFVLGVYLVCFGVVVVMMPVVVRFFEGLWAKGKGKGEKKKKNKGWDLKVVSVGSGLALVAMLVLGEYMGWCSMAGEPVVMAVGQGDKLGEVVKEVVRGKGEGAVGSWGVVASWPLVASVLGATVLPVVMVQAVG